MLTLMIPRVTSSKENLGTPQWRAAGRKTGMGHSRATAGPMGDCQREPGVMTAGLSLQSTQVAREKQFFFFFHFYVYSYRVDTGRIFRSNLDRLKGVMKY